MYKFLSSDSGSFLTLWPAASLVCAVLTQLLYNPDAELLSEVLCWALLPFFLNGRAGTLHSVWRSTKGLISRNPITSNNASSAPSPFLLVVAVGLGVATLVTSELASRTLLVSMLRSNHRVTIQLTSVSLHWYHSFSMLNDESRARARPRDLQKLHPFSPLSLNHPLLLRQWHSSR